MLTPASKGAILDQFVSGTATADFFHTLTLDHLDLYGANGLITDITSITGESGTVYAVDASAVPEPETSALVACGLIGLALVRRRRDC